MANQTYIQPGGSTVYRKSDGTGTDIDPFLPHFKEDALRTAHGTPVDLPANKTTLTATPATAYNEIQLLKALLLESGATQTYSNEVTQVTAGAVTDAYPANGQVIIDCKDWRYLNLWIQNTGATAISAVKLEGALSTGLEFKYKYIAETSANYTTESGKNGNNQLIHVIESSGLPTIATSAEGWVQLWVATLDRVKVSCKTASGSTTVQINGKLLR